LSPLRDNPSNFWSLVKKQAVGKSVQEVSKHRIALAAVLIRKLLMLRRAPGRARTCNPMIRSHNVEFQSCFCPGNDAAGDSRTLWAHRGRQTVFEKCPRSVQASKTLIRHNLRKFLMSKRLPRMDSNHDKVIQSLLWSMIGYEPI
jgi:hypothetical protein